MKIEEARETLKHIGEHIKVHDEHGLIYSAQLVGALEIADAAMEKQMNTVKCGECKHCHNAPFGDHLICRVHSAPHRTGPDNFCNWGERQ